MKKIISIILILSLVILSNIYSENSLINVVANSFDEYEILENTKSYQVVKINDNNYENIMDNFDIEIISKNEVSDRLIIEGYCNELDDYIVINNRKVNIQISINENYIIIGYPLIKNSF